MTKQQPHWLDRFATHETRRMAALASGWFIILLSAPVGALPGPGGIFVFAFGLALVLRNSLWAKRQYVHFKRRWPRIGHWSDKGLRRKPAPRGRPGAYEAVCAARAEGARAEGMRTKGTGAEPKPVSPLVTPPHTPPAPSRNLEVRPRQGTAPLVSRRPASPGPD